MANRKLHWIVLSGLALILLAISAGPGASHAAAQTATEAGLEARYYDNKNLTSPKLARTDPQINFSWGKGSPNRRIAPDTFSARWTGQVEAPTSGTYTFYAYTSDGVRLWVDGELVIDEWSNQSAREWSGDISLQAGERYAIKMEYFEGRGRATAKLLWSRPGVDKEVVPSSRLYLPGTPPPSPTEGLRWSDPATWGGAVPRAGEAVTIPSGKIVLLDTSPPPLKSLQIDGTLVFDDRDLALSADWIMVHGKLQIGTEGAPFHHKATISLTGTNRDENVMGMGPKVLGVMGGTLELHGEQPLNWTKLGATATKGSTQITLDKAPDWRPGDRIVVSSTDYNPLQAEEATIKAVSGNVVTLDKALAYTHWGSVQTFDGRPVDERAEVALLSHNVMIEGEAASSADGFGGQIMVMGGGAARLEGVELTRMGQKNILRRYPIHFHMLGDAPGSYLRNSSLHHTFNRCVTVHGTNRLTLQGNVCHDHIGHGYFLEDGAEVGNLLEGNLGLVTRMPADGQRLLPSDGSPATFWITNPDNLVRNNVAAGSEGMGFWYALPEHPTGLSTNTNVWPRRTPLGEFSGNVAHSNDDTGLHVDDGPSPDGSAETSNYRPRENPATSSLAVPAEFTDFTSYKNRNRGVWLRGSDLRLVGAKLADNAIGATFASWETFLQDSLIVGETDNKGNPRSWETKGLDGRSLPRFWEPDFPIRGFEFYDGRVGAENTTFVNFTSDTQRQASGLGYNLSNAFSIHPKNFASGVSFVDANRVYLPDPETADPVDGDPATGKDGDASSVFLDTDGSVTGMPGRYVVVNNPFLLNGSCDFRTAWNAHVCHGEYVTLTVGTDDGDPSDIKPVMLRRDDGEIQTLWGCCDDYTYADSNVFPNQGYEVAFNTGTPSRMTFALERGRDRWVHLSLGYPVAPKVTKYGCDLADPTKWCKGAARSLAELDAMTRSGYYYDPDTKKLHLRLVSTDTDYEELKVGPSP
jgi:hypothetical protein